MAPSTNAPAAKVIVNLRIKAFSWFCETAKAKKARQRHHILFRTNIMRPAPINRVREWQSTSLSLSRSKEYLARLIRANLQTSAPANFFPPSISRNCRRRSDPVGVDLGGLFGIQSPSEKLKDCAAYVFDSVELKGGKPVLKDD
jgi:hypothetical protein